MTERIMAVTGGEAVSRILAGLLDELLMNESGAVAALNIAHLHNYRVALRRARVIVSQYKEVMPADDAALFLSELRWLGQVTGQLRDTDVYLASIKEYEGWLPDELKSFFLPFQEYLLRNRKSAHEKFTGAITDARYTLFISYWKTFLTRGVAHWDNQAWSLFEETCSAKIWRLYKKMVRKGHLIDRDSPAVSLHELRKDGKKLRYLIEFFYEVADRDEKVRSSQQLKHLRRLQSILGDHQDCVVQAETLMQFSTIHSQNVTASRQTFLALGVLIGNLNARQVQARAKFDAGLKKFCSKRSKREFRALCQSRNSEQAKVS